jgi:hypothetical protein
MFENVVHLVMAYFAMAPCGQCNTPFSFNPHLVPSLNNVPFCESCVNRANPIRVKNGLKPIKIVSGAYKPQYEETDTDHYFGGDNESFALDPNYYDQNEEEE